MNLDYFEKFIVKSEKETIANNNVWYIPEFPAKIKK